MKYTVVTFGCRVNQAESFVIEDTLRNRGGEAVDIESADLVVVNSCSVTASADQGTRQTVRRIGRVNPDAKIVVTGCYATRRPGDVAELPNVVRIVSNERKDEFAQELETLGIATRFVDGDGPCGSALRPGAAGRTALTLRVQTGCDEHCSYCVIPKTRGSSRSTPLNRVLAEVDRAIGAGYKEIVITGVHLGSYGRDLATGESLARLLERLAAREEDVLFRVSSLEPMDCTDEVVDVMANSGRLAPHFHLPLQHASDRVLRAMRRPYTSDDYRRLVTRIHDAMPWAAIGSDLIVGFPGEDATDARFNERFVADLPLSHLHVFPYSDRPGTEASRQSDKVDGALVRDRGRALRDIGSELARRFRASQSGTTRRALTVDDGRSAVTDNYIKVPLSEANVRNTWLEVTIP